MLASLLALLSYVPFEVVAKVSLLVCVALFILDPLPPVTRLLSLVATIVVALLSKWYRQAMQAQRQEEALAEESKKDS